MSQNEHKKWTQLHTYLTHKAIIPIWEWVQIPLHLGHMLWKLCLFALALDNLERPDKKIKRQ